MDRDVELQLVERLRVGDPDAFDVVHAAFNGRLYNFLARLSNRRDVAEDLAGTPVGTIPPFSFDERLELFVDPELLEFTEVFFNAARFDRTIALATADYLAAAKPRVESITRAEEPDLYQA